jgi:hypothetical protein
MNEPLTRPAARAANQSQIHRTERGVVAGYIHEVSQRHDNRRAPEPNAQPSSERGEGG